MKKAGMIICLLILMSGCSTYRYPSDQIMDQFAIGQIRDLALTGRIDGRNLYRQSINNSYYAIESNRQRMMMDRARREYNQRY